MTAPNDNFEGFNHASAIRRIAKHSRPIDSGCWQWVGSIMRNGYAVMGCGQRTWLAHRVSYIVHRGLIPEGMVIDHLCRNRACVNPDHLEVVTFRENVMRGENMTAANARKTHCANGHPYDEKNTYLDGRGRKCRICVNEAQRRYQQRKKAAHK